jgi:hypothetical protein
VSLAGEAAATSVRQRVQSADAHASRQASAEAAKEAAAKIGHLCEAIEHELRPELLAVVALLLAWLA